MIDFLYGLFVGIVAIWAYHYFQTLHLKADVARMKWENKRLRRNIDFITRPDGEVRKVEK